MKKWMLVFALAGLSVAGTKTYSVTFSDPVTLGGTQLKPGDYRLRLEGSHVTFTKRGKVAAQADAKIETAKRKLPYTEVEMKNANGKQQLEGIWLGGTDMKLQFN